jgi:hypothetical protein
MSPRRLKGLGAFASAATIYSYLPYIAVYFGSTMPIMTACVAGLYGMLAFSESYIVNSIQIEEQGEHAGKLRINVGTSAFSSSDIIVEARDVKSILSLGEDEVDEGNVIVVQKYYCMKSQQVID